MEDFVTYEQAVKLKELGFDYKCNHFYCQPTKEHELRMVEYVPADFLDAHYHNFNNPDMWADHNENTPSAPTLAQVHKWLREQHKLWLEPVICIHNINYYSCDLYDLKTADEYDYMDGPTTDIEGTFNTPEEALLAGIDKALKMIENHEL